MSACDVPECRNFGRERTSVCGGHAAIAGARRITVNGITDTISGWSRRNGVKANTILLRLHAGWPEERAVSAEKPIRGRVLDVNGKSMSVAEWSRETGIKRNTIYFRLSSGWKPEDAVRVPPTRGSHV